MIDIDTATISLIIVAAFMTGVLHGTTGMAGGVVMAAILAHIIGIKAAVPAMTCALVFSHLTRMVLHRHETDWLMARRILAFGAPMVVVGALLFSYLTPRVVAMVFAVFLTASLPIKHWARKHQIKTGPKLLAGASAVWGLLAGNVIGPGFFLAPFLLGTGINRMTFVGTMATITLAMNIIKLIVFGGVQLMNWPLLMLGIMIGVTTIPANWAGRLILRRINDANHVLVVDVLTVLIIVNFAYLAFSNTA